MTTSLATQKPMALQPKTPMDLLQIALEKEAAIDVIERLAALQLQMQDRDDRVRFSEAMAAFKAEMPKILRTREIRGKRDANGNPGPVRYKAVALEDVADPLIKALLKHGITYRYKCDMLGTQIKVTCYLRLQGTAYEEEGSTLAAPPDISGDKDPLKAVGSTTSYLEKYTLLASCGVHVYGSDPEAVPPQTSPEDLMDESVVMEFVDTIKGSADADELKRNYLAATKAGTKDPSALRAFDKAKKETWNKPGFRK